MSRSTRPRAGSRDGGKRGRGFARPARRTCLQPRHQRTWRPRRRGHGLARGGARGPQIAAHRATYRPTVGRDRQRSSPRLKMIIEQNGAGPRHQGRGGVGKMRRCCAGQAPDVRSRPPVAQILEGATYPQSEHPRPTCALIHHNRSGGGLRAGADVLGTDITRMPGPWRQCVTLFTEELQWLKDGDLELGMGSAVCDGSTGRFRRAEAPPCPSPSRPMPPIVRLPRLPRLDEGRAEGPVPGHGQVAGSWYGDGLVAPAGGGDGLRRAGDREDSRS